MSPVHVPLEGWSCSNDTAPRPRLSPGHVPKPPPPWAPVPPPAAGPTAGSLEGWSESAKQTPRKGFAPRLDRGSDEQMLPIIFIPPGPSPSGDCKPTVEKADGALSLLSFPHPLSKAWKRHIPTRLRQWPQKWGRRLSSLFSLSMTTFSIPRISLLFFFFFLTTCLVSSQWPTFAYVVRSFILLKNLNTLIFKPSSDCSVACSPGA